MKKVLLPLIAALAVSASAQVIPNSFNYQGVIEEKNAKVIATFELVASDGTVVWDDDQIVYTNMDGAFTAVIGSGEKWNEAWTNTEEAYTIKVTINDQVVECPLRAVPYANVAATVIGLDYLQNDVAELAADNRVNKTDIAEMKVWQANVGENLENLTPVIDYLLEGVTTNQMAIEEIMSGEEGTPLASLHEMDLQLYNNLVDVQEDVDANKEAIAIVSDDLQGLVEAQRGKANVEDVTALQETVSAIEADIIQLQEDLVTTVALQEDLDETNDVVEQLNKTVTNFITSFEEEYLAPIQAQFDNIDENAVMTNELIETLVEGVDANKEAIAIVSDDLQGLVEAQRGKANVEDVTALQETVSAIEADIIQLQEDLVTTVALQEDLDETNDVVEQLNKTVTNFITSFEEEYLAPIQAQFDNIDENAVMTNELIETLVEGVDANKEAIAIVSDDLQGLVEAQRGKANVEDVTALQETVSAIEADIIQLQEDLVTTVALQEDLDETNDVVEQLNKTVTNFITSFNDEYMVPIYDQFESVDAKIGRANLNIDDNTDKIKALNSVINDLTKKVAALEAAAAK